ncbi:S-layer family protein [Sphingobium sp. EM0848]|uniref:beta strand repeat-containing protein n=1 Tax=Sphingobium sp. EM0848 TaxID=2743473 RepID=UPI00159C5A51|nr:DUF5801 repeats-in-toxin domain-containing protein [Sphingobium sp. EM0848]
MASITITGTAILDESLGLQTPATSDTGNDIAFSDLQAAATTDADVLAFYNRLFGTGAGQLALSASFATANGIAKTADNFISVDAAGGTVNSLGFDDGSGGALPVWTGVANFSAGVLTTFDSVDGGDIRLFADPVLGSRAALGYDSSGHLVFALLLDPNAGLTQAKVWMVQFEAIKNPDFPSNYDDPVNLFDTLGVSAGTTTHFDFSTLPSGNNLFGMVGTTTNAIVVIGANPDPVGTGFSNTSDTINTSKGGGSVTIGVNDQNFNPGEAAYFTYVSGANANFVGAALDANEADNVANIDFTSRIEVGAASTKIVQVSGNNLAVLTIKAFNGDNSLDGAAFDPTPPSGASALGNGTAVPILRIEVRDANGALVQLITNPVADSNGVYTVSNLNDNYTIKWYTQYNGQGAVHDQVLLGSGAGEKFDIGGFDIDQPNSARADIGAQLIFQDDGPTVAAVPSTNFVQHDETPGVQNGGADPADKDVAGSAFIAGSSGPTVDSLFSGVVSTGDLDVTPKDTGNAIGFARSGGSLLTTPTGSFGSDGAGTVPLSYALSVSDGTYSGVSTTGGTQIFLYNGSGATAGLILGRVGNELAGGDTANANGDIAFALAVDSSTGEAFIAQYLSLNHPTGGASYDETITLLAAAVQMSVTRTDGDGDTAVDSNNNVGDLFKFDDDGPTVAATPSTNFVQHDETAGVQNGGADADDKDVAGSAFIAGSSGPTVDSLFSGVVSTGDPDVTPKDTGNAIGFARSGGSLLTTPTGSFGSDGAGTVPLSYALSVSDGTYSGVSTTGGTQIFLYNGSGATAGLILGRVGNELAGGDTANANGAIAFALAVGSTTGEAFIAQYLSLSHGNIGSNDETITLLAAAVQMSVTRTDGDGDTAVDSDNNVGDLFKFDDDGPTVAAVPSTNFVQHDETPGVQNGGADPADKDVAGSAFITGSSGPTVGSLFSGVVSTGDPDVTPKDTGNAIGFARSGGSLLTTPTGSFGSDGAGTVPLSYALSVSDGTYSGVSTTGGTQIFLYNGSGATAGLILGRVGNELAGSDTANANGDIAFALAVGSTTGEAFIAQYLSLNHPTGGASYDETITLLAAAVQMSVTRTDGDGDTAVDSDNNVGDLFKFDDDGPTVAATPSTNFVQHDETPGVQNGGADPADKDVAGSAFIAGSSGPTVDSLFSGVVSTGDLDVTPKDTGNAIGFARSGGSLLTTPTGSFGSDGAGTVPLSYALSVSDGTYSGVSTTGGTQIFLYNGSGATAGLILGRVGNELAGGDTANANGDIAFALAVDSSTGEAFIAQYLSLNHPTGGASYDETITLLAAAVQMSVTRTDGDGDSIADSDNNVGDLFRFDDDGPNANGTAVTANVDEDGAIVVTGNPGGPGDDPTSARSATGSIAGIFAGGSDGVKSYQLSTDTSGLPAVLTSKGGTIVYNVNTVTQTLTGYVEVSGAGFDPLVDRTVFTLALSGTNNSDYTFTLVDQLDHAAPPAGTAFENEITLNLGSVLQVVDGDNDTATAAAEKLVITVDDDSPIIAAQIISGVVDFTNGSSVSSSLNGSVGFDENNATNQSAAGTKTYTFTSYTGDADSPFSAAMTTLFPGIHAVLSADGTTVNYYSTAGTANPLYQIVLGDQGGAGSYTFTAQQTAPNLSFDFDFGNMPANQNLFGLIAANEGNIDTKGTVTKADDTLPDGGVLIIAQGVNLKADNSYSNTSQTINTSSASQISGATIGVSNQAFEGGTFNPAGADTRGDAAFFVYVDNPYVSSTSGLPNGSGGLTSTTADDADSIKFTGLLEVRTASVTAVQAQLQGNPFVGMKIEAFHHTNENLARRIHEAGREGVAGVA